MTGRIHGELGRFIGHDPVRRQPATNQSAWNEVRLNDLRIWDEWYKRFFNPSASGSFYRATLC